MSRQCGTEGTLIPITIRITRADLVEIAKREAKAAGVDVTHLHPDSKPRDGGVVRVRPIWLGLSTPAEQGQAAAEWRTIDAVDVQLRPAEA